MLDRANVRVVVREELDNLVADRARRIRALAGSVAYHAWASSHLTGDLSPVLYGVCLDKAARIIDALDALPVPAKEEERC
jgi:hypothetical protein